MKIVNKIGTKIYEAIISYKVKEPFNADDIANRIGADYFLVHKLLESYVYEGIIGRYSKSAGKPIPGYFNGMDKNAEMYWSRTEFTKKNWERMIKNERSQKV